MEKREAQPLDPWIIEEIRRHEREKQEEDDHRREQPSLPAYDEPPPDGDIPKPDKKDAPDRGMDIIQL